MKPRNKRWLLCMWLGIASPCAAGPGINAGTVSASAGSAIDLPITFTTGAAGVSALQFDLILPTGVSYNSVSAGSAASAASKTVQAAAITGGIRGLIFFTNQTLLGNGPVASVRLNVSSGQSAGTLFIPTTGLVASGPAGTAVAITGNTGVLTITGGSGGFPNPTLNNLPDQIPVNANITAEFPSGYSNVTFQWTLTLVPSANVSTFPSGAAAAANGANVFSTQNNSLNLGVQPHPLQAGTYDITVQASDTLGHTSAMASKRVALVSPDLAAVQIYPNPWRQDRHSVDITFRNLPGNSTVKIFTVSGHEVRTLTPAGGTVSWNRKNESGDPVASGVYLYLITTTDGQKAKGKLAIIR